MAAASQAAGAGAAIRTVTTRPGWLRRAVTWVAGEPFFQFLALGALLFALSEYLEARANFARIDIGRDQIEGIKNNYRLQYGATPGPEQLDSLVEQFIKEEVFYHEALRLKLDKGDEIIRRRLVQKFEFLQQDLGMPHDPSDAELRAFYRSHSGNYTSPERATFSHVFFSVDRGGEEQAKARAVRALAELGRDGVTRAPDRGDAFPGAVDYALATPTQVRRAFGSSSLSDELFTVMPGQWSGPFRSGFGWHLVYVAARAPERIAGFDEARDAVLRDYLDTQRSLRNAETYEKLKRHFNIVRE